MVFSNPGDFPPYSKANDMKFGSEIERQRYLRSFDSEFKRVLRSDTKAVDESLTALFGKGTHRKFGEGTGEWVDWWEWKDHVFMLTSGKAEYVGLRIMSVDMANAGGKALKKISDPEMKAILAQRVKRRANGDVVITDIPMVNQGPKGYCVPATWERYLRYMGIPADMYELAAESKSEKGGGTVLSDMVEAVTRLVSRSGRRIQYVKPVITIHNIAVYVDAGLPMMWPIRISQKFEDSLTSRMADRSGMSDMAAWNEQLKPFRRALVKDQAEKLDHMCMIIGYNPQTKEIAISDSWGPKFEERWMMIEEAETVSAGQLLIINW
jgi:hypothetical protein